DIGTGTGRMLELFASRIEAGQGIDLSRDMLAVARMNLERAGIRNCSVRQGDLYQLPFPDGSFEAVTIHQVLHYTDDPARAIAEAARVLRPGGILLLADFAPHACEELRSEHSHRRLGFSEAEVAAWFEDAGLALRKVVHLPGEPLTVSVWLAARPGARAGDSAAARRVGQLLNV
ncbi:MAG: class I SAM-dependent methyltransferase, partial [Rhodospirillales bacterium]